MSEPTEESAQISPSEASPSKPFTRIQLLVPEDSQDSVKKERNHLDTLFKGLSAVRFLVDHYQKFPLRPEDFFGDENQRVRGDRLIISIQALDVHIQNMHFLTNHQRKFEDQVSVEDTLGWIEKKHRQEQELIANINDFNVSGREEFDTEYLTVYTKEGLLKAEALFPGVIHDIKNKLTALKGFVHLTKAKERDAKDPDTAKKVANINQIFGNFKKEIDNSMQSLRVKLAAVDNPDITTESLAQSIDTSLLQTFVQLKLNDHLYSMGEKGLKEPFAIEVEELMPDLRNHSVKWSLTRAEMLLQNVLFNAYNSVVERRKADPEFDETAQLKVRFELTDDKRYMRIIFQDNGVGFKEKSGVVHFDRGVSGWDEKTRGFGGAGEGMSALAYEMTDIYKGDLYGQPRVDGRSGAEIVAVLPIAF